MDYEQVKGAGVALAVQELGQGHHPTVVLVHGFPDTHAVWEPLAARLAAGAPEQFHVVTYDVRGAGASDRPPRTSDYRLPLLVEDLAAVIDATSPDRPVHLVAHDWGSVQGWEAVASERLRGRIASFTSISGPSLDHVGLWAARNARRGWRGWTTLVAQWARSSYIGAFHLPGAVRVTVRLGRSSRLRAAFARGLRRREGVDTDDRWPAPTFGADAAHGMRLYRANVGVRLRRPQLRTTEVPVQLVVPRRDPYVPPSLLVGIEQFAPSLWRREVDAGHWVVRSHPEELAAWVTEFASHVAGPTELPSEPLQHRNEASV